MLILVGYASAHGSTRQIAERVGSRLRRGGAEVRVAPIGDLHDIGGYDAVVLGSAIHNGAWLPEALPVIRANAEALAARPVWLFSVGMVDALPRRLRAKGRREGPKAVAELEDLVHPQGTRLFSGAVRRDQLSHWGRILFRIMGCRYGDYRAWSEIEAWAGEIGDQLAREAARPASSEPL